MNHPANLSRTLRLLHRELIEAARREHESVFGRVESPHALLELLQNDLVFAWLKPLTAALAELDDAIDDREQPERLPAALARVDALVNGCDASFARRYATYLQDVPDVAIAHGAVRSALRELDPARAA